MILDLGLPQKDGLEVLAEIGERFRSTLLMVLTARAEIIVEVYINYLRKKLDRHTESRPGCQSVIRTMRGEGYVLRTNGGSAKLAKSAMPWSGPEIARQTVR